VTLSATAALVAIFYGGSLNLYTLFAYSIGVQLLLLVYFAVRLKRNGTFDFRPRRLAPEEVSKTLAYFYRYSSPLVFVFVTGFLINYFDRWLLQFVNGSVSQGYFSLGLRLSIVCILFSSAMTPLFIQSMARAHAEDDQERIRSTFRLTGVFYFLTAFISVFFAFHAGESVFIIGGDEYTGAAATMSHTASLAGSFEAFKAACKQAGFYLLEELTEDPKIVINILSILTTQKPAKNNRVGVVSVGGGAAILIADHITSHGMTLTTFSEETRSRLADLLKSKVHAANDSEKARIAKRVADNPLDLFGDADDERLVQSIRILNEDPNTDIIVLGLYLQVPYLSEYVGERLAEVQAEMEKPLIISARGHSPYVLRMREYMTRHNVHTYTVPMIKPLSVALDIWRRYRTDFGR